MIDFLFLMVANEEGAFFDNFWLEIIKRIYNFYKVEYWCKDKKVERKMTKLDRDGNF